MTSSGQLDKAIERVVIFAVVLWGSWAIYYWLAAFGVDASFTQLKTFSPIFLLLVVTSTLLFVARGFTLLPLEGYDYQEANARTFVHLNWRRMLLYILIGVIGMAMLFVISKRQFTNTPLGYNLLWSALLPIFLAYAFHFRRSEKKSPLLSYAPTIHVTVLDPLLCITCAVVLAVLAYGVGYPTPDDTYYGFVFAATLANPDAPVLGMDLLLGTDAPWMLHPAYRAVGYEVFIAFVSAWLQADPLYLYFTLFPSISSALWVFASYLLLLTWRVPFPGLALVVIVVSSLFWTGPNGPGWNIGSIYWGKSMLFFIGAPLLFVAMSAFVQWRGWMAWYFLLLSVSAVSSWSSSGLFLVPVSVALAYFIYQSRILNFANAFAAASTLLPVLAVLLCTLFVLAQAPVFSSQRGIGFLRVRGEAFGGLSVQMVFLLLLALLPMAAQLVANSRFRRLIFRLSLVGFFTIFTPVLLEFTGELLGSNFLASRLFYAFPFIQLIGVAASLLIVAFYQLLRSPLHRAVPVLILLITAFFAAVYHLGSGMYVHGAFNKLVHTLAWDDVREARAVRALIDDPSYVVAGGMEELLAMLPDPPGFVAARHYLGFHRMFIPNDEFKRRMRLNGLLEHQKLPPGATVQEAVKSIIVMSQRERVTSLVFHTPGGRHRPDQLLTLDLSTVSPEKERFVQLLAAALGETGFTCKLTPSERTWVCNRVTTTPQP